MLNYIQKLILQAFKSTTIPIRQQSTANHKTDNEEYNPPPSPLPAPRIKLNLKAEPMKC